MKETKAKKYQIHYLAKKEIKEKGITLVALVVTIVVLLILAGITLTFVLGENSVFSKASQAKIQTEIGKIEERAQIIYSSKMMQTASGTLNTTVETSQVISQLIAEGYTIEDRSVAEGDITGISLDKTNIAMGKNKTVEITVTYEGVEEPLIYYAEVQGKYYQMHSNKGFITIERRASNLTKADFEAEGGAGGEETPSRDLTITSNPTGIVTAGLKTGSTSIIEIASSETEGDTTITVTYGSFEPKTCTVKVKEPVPATALELNSVRARIATGATRWLNAVATPAGAEQEFEWTSSNADIATVDSTGKITAKNEGTAIITVKTKDGTNLSQECNVTIANAVDVETLTEIQTGEKNIIAKDSNGNLITVPVGFKVLMSEGTKVTDGIVISDNTNEFVWVPIDSVQAGTEKPADDIRLGRYEDFVTKNATGNYMPKQDSDNYTKSVAIVPPGAEADYRETSGATGNTPAKSLGTFVRNTKANGGYYLARYEASGGSGDTTGSVKSQYNQPVWTNITQQTAATNCRNMYLGNRYVWSDLVNSYAWDTAIIFIQKYSGKSKYASKASVNSSLKNTGKAGDKVCNIHDMASNCLEWSTEHSMENKFACVHRGGSM